MAYLRDPDVQAIFEPGSGRRLSFRSLNDSSDQVAQALAATGVGPGDRIGLLTMNSADFVETFLSAAKIGAVAVPLNGRLTPDGLEFILIDSGTSVLVYSEEFAAPVAQLHHPRRQDTPVTCRCSSRGCDDSDDWLR